MIKYINYGNPKYGTHMFIITMFKTEYGNYLMFDIDVLENNKDYDFLNIDFNFFGQFQKQAFQAMSIAEIDVVTMKQCFQVQFTGKRNILCHDC